MQDSVDLERVLPPVYNEHLFLPGFGLERREVGEEVETSKTSGRRKVSRVYVGAALMRQLGATECIIFMDDRIVRGSLYVRRMLITPRATCVLG